MIVLRQEQIAVMELPGLLQFVKVLCEEVRKQFINEVAYLSEIALEKKILKTIKKAQKFNLSSKTDWRRFVFLAIEYEWDFDEDPDNEWMITMLEDPEITSPSNRLTRLIDECAYRKQVAEQNEKLWDEFYGADSDDDDDFDDEDDIDDDGYNEVVATGSVN